MRWGELAWPEIRDRASRAVVVAPLGSLEQHGHHLPLLTDTLIISAMAERAEASLGDEALFLPTLWLGASHHHLAFPGTVSLDSRLYVDVLIQLVESLVKAGCRRILLLNGHGGNITPGREAILQAQLRHLDRSDLFIAFTTWWVLAGPQVAAIPDLESKVVSHACEQETSLILRIRHDLVHPERARGETPTLRSAFAVPGRPHESRVDVALPFDRMTGTGALHHPEAATEAKGEALIAAAAGELARFVREFGAWSDVERA